MPIDGLNNKQIERLIRNDINNIKNSFFNKNNSYSINEKNFNHKIHTIKNINKIVLN
jgi:hypothetical protein